MVKAHFNCVIKRFVSDNAGNTHLENSKTNSTKTEQFEPLPLSITPKKMEYPNN